MLRVSQGKYRREHLIVMEKHLGRKLYRDEVVHHLDGKRDNNELDNLMLLVKRDHDKYHMICRINDIDYIKHSRDDVLDIINQD